MHTSELILFLLRQRFFGFEIHEEPFFDSLSTVDWFINRLKKSSGYLEFGSGGSTYIAAKLGVPFITVDSDKWFMEDVKRKIIDDGYYRAEIQKFRYVNIGLTGPWGVPITWRGMPRLCDSRFRFYSDPPLNEYKNIFSPDLVLIDGRFRVACALKALKFFIKSEGQWEMLVDDYTSRSEYHVIEQFSSPIKFIGRMALFNSIKSNINIDEMNSLIEHYEMICD